MTVRDIFGGYGHMENARVRLSESISGRRYYDEELVALSRVIADYGDASVSAWWVMRVDLIDVDFGVVLTGDLRR